MTLVLEEKENHDQAVKRFRSLCDMHRVPCGQAGDLRQFMSALKENRHFAMDFWAMVGDLSARERGTLSDDEMLAMIVEGSSGKTISELPLNEKVVTAGLKNLLAGVDVDAGLLEEEVSAPAGGPSVEAPAEHLPLTEATRRVEAERSAETSRVAAAAETKHSVEEALRRLEETSRELRNQLAALAAMDQLRREAGEQATAAEKETQASPVPRDASSSVAAQQVSEEAQRAATARYAAETREPASSSASLPTAEPVLSPRRPMRILEERGVFEPSQHSTLSHRGFVPRDADDDPSIHVPLAEYAEENPSRIGVGTILLIVLVAALIVGGFALHKGYGRDQVASAKAAMLNKIGLFGAELHDVASPSSQPASQSGQASNQPGGQNGNEPQSSAPAPAPGERAPILQPSQADNHSQLTLPEPSQQHNPAGTQQNARRSRAVADAQNYRRVARPEAMPIEPGAVRVSSSVMSANLLSSRVAVYPEDARTRGIEGTVEVEAVISRTGAVEYARAVSGDPHLRSAAEEAVMKWRYKPYTINGTPVQAVTQVRVNFRLR
jgi:TonB family protein